MFLGVPKIFYQSSLFLSASHVKYSKRTVQSMWSGGLVQGALGQMHLDVLEACFLNQLHLLVAEDGLIGIKYDPYHVRKAFHGRLNNGRIERYLEDLNTCQIEMKFNPGEVNIEANGPIISKIQDIEAVPCPQLKKDRVLKALYFPRWFTDLCEAPPFFKPRDTFFDIEDPLERAVRRFMRSHKDAVKYFTARRVCEELGISTSDECQAVVNGFIKSLELKE